MVGQRGVSEERVDDEFAGTYECARCGFETPAVVHAWSGGAARGRGDDARAAAREQAQERAGAMASRTLMFVRCPKCGQRDPKARVYQVQIVLAALAMGAAGFAVLFVGLMKLRADAWFGDWTPVLAAACGATWAVRTYTRYRRAWVGVASRVKLGAPTS
jgi:predicted RNA-binding Zn-ribbon protein involved in translation (DUF1610 family)